MRIEVVCKSGEKLSVLIERNEWACFKREDVVAVLNDWDEGCKTATGLTPTEAVSALCDLIDEELPEGFTLPDSVQS